MTHINTCFEVTVRLFDLDINNHVNNSVYFTYMEEARTKLLLNEYLYCKKNGVNFIVAEATCKYKKPIINLQEQVLIKVDVQNLKRVSFDFIYTFTNKQGDVYAEGKTRMACVNSNTHKPIRLPVKISEFLENIITR